MVTVPDNTIEIQGNTVTATADAFPNVIARNPEIKRPFPSFPNLAPKGEPIKGTSFLDTPEHRADMIARDKEISRTVDAMIARRNVMWEPTVRTCIARLKAARAKESTNRNLSTLLAVVVKVQKDLETLVGDEWKHQDAAAESQVTRDDRSL